MSSSSKKEIYLHMGNIPTSWSGDLAGCQSTPDLHNSNMLYANQTKIIDVNLLFIIITIYCVIKLFLE